MNRHFYLKNKNIHANKFGNTHKLTYASFKQTNKQTNKNIVSKSRTTILHFTFDVDSIWLMKTSAD